MTRRGQDPPAGEAFVPIGHNGAYHYESQYHGTVELHRPVTVRLEECIHDRKDRQIQSSARFMAIHVFFTFGLHWFLGVQIQECHLAITDVLLVDFWYKFLEKHRESKQSVWLVVVHLCCNSDICLAWFALRQTLIFDFFLTRIQVYYISWQCLQRTISKYTFKVHCSKLTHRLFASPQIVYEKCPRDCVNSRYRRTGALFQVAFRIITQHSTPVMFSQKARGDSL